MVQRYETLSMRTIRLSPNTYFSIETGGRYFSQSIILEISLILSSIVGSSIRLFGKYLACSKESPKAHKRFDKYDRVSSSMFQY